MIEKVWNFLWKRRRWQRWSGANTSTKCYMEIGNPEIGQTRGKLADAARLRPELSHGRRSPVTDRLTFRLLLGCMLANSCFLASKAQRKTNNGRKMMSLRLEYRLCTVCLFAYVSGKDKPDVSTVSIFTLYKGKLDILRIL